jgi:hypothetical protein
MDFSPYVRDVEAKIMLDGPPPVLSPLSLRLTNRDPTKTLSFLSDINGYFCVMQEVDTANEPKAKVTLRRRICPDLSWSQRVGRRVNEILTWNS